ncbi:MAG: hypothetical protein HN981_02215 [Candidatus Pacebacteria bacterium]|jgi:hypothetical protein|nr:hypothetical protein [Candidatus Paceibacterota bacterium]MBT6921185.1 hypothetical protein [Candidatus Paceibacterota bacterium]
MNLRNPKSIRLKRIGLLLAIILASVICLAAGLLFLAETEAGNWLVMVILTVGAAAFAWSYLIPLLCGLPLAIIFGVLFLRKRNSLLRNRRPISSRRSRF